VNTVSEDVEVARAGEGDLAVLASLRYRWRVEEAGERGEGVTVFEAKFRAWYDEHRATHAGYLAKVEGDAIGCAWLYTIDRVPGPEKFVRRAGILQSVYVVPSQRSRGVGEGLVRRIIEDAKESELDYLMVHPSALSFSFYRRLGFTESQKLLELRFA
jgi:N-acetylglutamate synthase-like GNAT family acetyltransferase